MKENIVNFRVSGRYALFTDPMTKIGGEKSSLMIPTAEALIGVTSSIYWKPSIKWSVVSVRVLNSIKTESKGIRPIKYDGGNDLAFYTYLRDVAYEVAVKFTFNENRKDLEMDWNENKHYWIAKRSIAKGGRRDVFLGTRECQAYVEEVTEGEKGAYDHMGEMDFGLMFHSFLYPDQSGKDELVALFWHPKMVDGVIEFCSQEECTTRKFIKKMTMKKFDQHNFSGLNEEGLFSDIEGGTDGIFTGTI